MPSISAILTTFFGFSLIFGPAVLILLFKTPNKKLKIKWAIYNFLTVIFTPILVGGILATILFFFFNLDKRGIIGSVSMFTPMILLTAGWIHFYLFRRKCARLSNQNPSLSAVSATELTKKPINHAIVAPKPALKSILPQKPSAKKSTRPKKIGKQHAKFKK
jgi:hypothetical protein